MQKHSCICGCNNPEIREVGGDYIVRCKICQCWRSIIIPAYIPLEQSKVYAKYKARQIHKVSPIDRMLEFGSTSGWHNIDCTNKKPQEQKRKYALRKIQKEMNSKNNP